MYRCHALQVIENKELYQCLQSTICIYAESEGGFRAIPPSYSLPLKGLYIYLYLRYISYIALFSMT